MLPTIRSRPNPVTNPNPNSHKALLITLLLTQPQRLRTGVV